MNLAEVRTEEQFLKIPFTVKKIYGTSAYDRTRTAPEDIYGLYSSNGTTGKQTFYVHSQKDHAKQAEFVKDILSGNWDETGRTWSCIWTNRKSRLWDIV